MMKSGELGIFGHIHSFGIRVHHDLNYGGCFTSPSSTSLVSPLWIQRYATKLPISNRDSLNYAMNKLPSVALGHPDVCSATCICGIFEYLSRTRGSWSPFCEDKDQVSWDRIPSFNRVLYPVLKTYSQTPVFLEGDLPTLSLVIDTHSIIPQLLE